MIVFGNIDTMGKFDRCYLCDKIDQGDGSVRYINLDPVCTDCQPDLPSPEGDTKQEGEVDILDHSYNEEDYLEDLLNDEGRVDYE